ncbi:TPA: hypothetical protein ACXKGF_004379 [Escherichia coli]
MASPIIAPSFSERVYTGTHGNESVAEGIFTVSSAAQSTEIHLLSLPIGIRINSVQLTSAKGLGGTATVSVKSGNHELVKDSGAVTASFAKHVVMEPYTTQKDGEVVTVTIKTNTATGTMNVLLRYTVVGH